MILRRKEPHSILMSQTAPLPSPPSAIDLAIEESSQISNTASSDKQNLNGTSPMFPPIPMKKASSSSSKAVDTVLRNRGSSKF